MIDYHVHSACSGDCTAPMLDVCRAAVTRGIRRICFTEHIDFEPTDSCFGMFDYAGYRAMVREAQQAFDGALGIGCGVEIDFQTKFRGEIEAFLDGKDFDYVLGAAHYVDGVILEDHDVYFPGKTPEQAYVPYFENVLATVQTGWFDTLAHLDLCKRYGVRYFGPMDWAPYRAQIEEILREVIGRGMALEINTSGLRQSPEDTYPSRDILDLYFALGGRTITVGSDSHRAEDVGAGIHLALETARQIGFESVAMFANRRLSPVPIIAEPR